MNIFNFTFLVISIFGITSCASKYKMIEPKSISYASTNENKDVKLEYKYNLLDKKYAKKETKKGVKLVALKITNNSNKDLIFGKDLTLSYDNKTEVLVLENNQVYKTLKQSPATYLLYLLLSPINLYTTESSSNGIPTESKSIPIGLIAGPGLAGGNMIAASSANKKFKSEMLEYDINGTLIKKGETKYGLIGIKSISFDSLKLKVK